MPAIVTHYLFACDVLASLPVDSRPVEDSSGLASVLSYSSFFWGAQGPDFLFFHRALPFWFGKSFRGVGTALHHCDPDRLFSAFLGNLRAESDDNVRKKGLWYAYGFLCHYALDSTAHPWIIAKALELSGGQGGRAAQLTHNLAEHALDTIVLEQKRGITPDRFSWVEVMPKDEVAICTQAHLMERVIPATLPGVAPPFRALVEAFEDSIRAARLLQDPRGGKRRFFSRLERVLRIGPALSGLILPTTAEKDVYAYLHGDAAATLPHCFDEIYDMALDTACRLIWNFGNAMTAESNFSTGGRLFSDGTIYHEE